MEMIFTYGGIVGSLALFVSFVALLTASEMAQRAHRIIQEKTDAMQIMIDREASRHERVVKELNQYITRLEMDLTKDGVSNTADIKALTAQVAELRKEIERDSIRNQIRRAQTPRRMSLAS